MTWSPNQVLHSESGLEVVENGEAIDKIAQRILNQRSFQPYLKDSCDPIQNLAFMIQNKVRPYVKEQVGKACSLTDDVAFGLWVVPSSSEWDTTTPLGDYTHKGIDFTYLMAGRTHQDTLYGIGIGCNFLAWWPQRQRIVRAWKFRCEEGQDVYHGTLYFQIGKAGSNGWKFESVQCRCYVDRPHPPELQSVNGLFWLDRQIRTKSPRLRPDYLEIWAQLRERVSAAASQQLQPAIANAQSPLVTENFEDLCRVAGLSGAEINELRPHWLGWRVTPPRENLVFEQLIWLERQAEVDFIGSLDESPPIWKLTPIRLRPPVQLGPIQLIFDMAAGQPMDNTALLAQMVAAYEQIKSTYQWDNVEKRALALQQVYQRFLIH